MNLTGAMREMDMILSSMQINDISSLGYFDPHMLHGNATTCCSFEPGVINFQFLRFAWWWDFGEGGRIMYGVITLMLPHPSDITSNNLYFPTFGFQLHLWSC